MQLDFSSTYYCGAVADVLERQTVAVGGVRQPSPKTITSKDVRKKKNKNKE
jgi:hypothetical protein